MSFNLKIFWNNFLWILIIFLFLFRFVLFSYPLQHSDGRSSFPLCFIFSSPRYANLFPLFSYFHPEGMLIHSHFASYFNPKVIVIHSHSALYFHPFRFVSFPLCYIFSINLKTWTSDGEIILGIVNLNYRSCIYFRDCKPELEMM